MAEDTRLVMVLGSGRLANRLTKFLKEKGLNVSVVRSNEFREVEETVIEESSMDYACEKLIQEGIMNVSTVCIVDTDDAVNLYLLMAVLAVRENVSLYVTFFNKSLVYDLSLKYRNIKIFNPADIVSKLFVAAVPGVMLKKDEVKISRTYNDNPRDALIFWLLGGFVWLILSGALFFYLTEPVDWLKSLYLVITVITSVNFNDAELYNSNWLVQVMRIGLMLATYAYVIFALAFIVDYIVRRRIDMMTLGRRRYNKKGHVIVCGLGRVGYEIVQDLFIKGEDIIIIESSQDNRYLPAVRAKKIPVLIGHATLSHYLIDAGIGRAKALVCAIDSDLTNIEIGRNAKAENSSVRLLLRISDRSTAEEIKKRLNIHYAFSKSFATATLICDRVCRNLLLEKTARTRLNEVDSL